MTTPTPPTPPPVPEQAANTSTPTQPDSLSASSSKTILTELNNWTPTDTEAKLVIELAKDSLEKVLKLTEHLDNKAVRLLTAIAFLSAMSATLYSGVYRNVQLADFAATGSYRSALVALFHGIYLFYGIFVCIGAGGTIYGIFPRFNIQPAWRRSQHHTGAAPSSFLFAPKITESGPSVWAKAFVKADAKSLIVDYAKNYIHETYLVSEKIETKMNKSRLGLLALCVAPWILLAWLIVTYYILSGG